MRCQPVPVSLDGAMLQRPEYHLGVMFTRTSAEALQVVTELCGGMLGVEDIPNRVLVIADDAQVGERVRRTVSEGGGMVRAIAPSAAVETARELQPDAIIVAPRAGGESSGWWTAIESLVADPVASAIPLIVIADPATMSADRRHYLTQRRAHVLRLTASSDEFLAALDRVAFGRADAPSA